MSDESTAVKFKRRAPDHASNDPVPCLIVMEGAFIGEVYRLQKDSNLIGRSENCDVQITEEGVSRKHARMDRKGDLFYLEDLGSTNGTFVNGEKVEKGKIIDGDKIQIGDVLLKFSFQDTFDVHYQESLRNMAMRDGLTKVFNRRFFLETIQREVSYALRQGQPLTCILFDIDHFKKINDTFGHQAGDQTLRVLSTAVQNELRKYDLLARYGGEEFVILLRATDRENGVLLAERVRKLAASLTIESDQSKFQFTVSVGVSTLDPKEPKTAEDLVKEADRFLYEAKEAGRNQVRSASGE